MNATFFPPTLLKPLLRLGLIFALGLLLAPPTWAQAAAKAVPLSNATIFIIRHAEKPKDGEGLAPEGEKRAQAYVNYFPSLRVNKQPLKLEHLFATADSKNSMRPRLTLEPLSRALKLPLDLRFEAEDFKALAKEVRTKDHGKALLICWHHGTIPELLSELGVKPAQLLPHDEWPDDVFNWVIELRYNAEGRLMPKHSQRITMRWAAP